MKKNSKKMFCGIDELIFDICSEDVFVKVKEKELINKHGIQYGEIYITSQKIKLKVNLPRAMGYQNNFFPYKYSDEDAMQLDLIKADIINALKKAVRGSYKNKVEKVELTAMIAVDSQDDIEKFCRLISEVFCDENKQSAQFINKRSDGFETVITGCVSAAIKNKLKIKVYDKGVKENMGENILRIEFVLLSRYLKQLFREESRTSIENILAAESLILLQKEFSVCYRTYVAPPIDECLKKTIRKLADKMIASRHPISAYREMTNKVHCLEEVRRALKMYAGKTGQSDNAKNRVVNEIKRKYGLNDNIYEILKRLKIT